MAKGATTRLLRYPSRVTSTYSALVAELVAAPIASTLAAICLEGSGRTDKSPKISQLWPSKRQPNRHSAVLPSPDVFEASPRIGRPSSSSLPIETI